MTRNQIAYWDLREKERNNRAVEAENRRSNLAKEAIQSRQNDINLSLGQGNLAESIRSHKVSELETARNNKSNNYIGWHNYKVNAQNADTNQQNAYTNVHKAMTERMNAQTNLLSLNEATRHNLATEHETTKHNRNTEFNQTMSNSIAATKSAREYDLGKMQLHETQTHNRNVENETNRKNVRDQQLKAAELQQTINRDKWNAYSHLLGNLSPNLSIRLGTIGGK